MVFADAQAAREEYDKASRRAIVEEILAAMTGRPADLLPFDEVQRILRAHQQLDRGVQMIPLDRIVGSVGRYRDFTRAFLPRSGSSRHRWTRLHAAMDRMEILPPIEVYKVGDIYFVKDGNHRVSVARAHGLKEIEAYVTELPLPEGVTVTPDMDLRDLVQEAEYQEFLRQTRLDKIRPGADVRLTEPGRYPLLKEHIDVHRYYLGLEQKREIPYEEAVASWYDNVYMPIVQKIREMGIMREFPGRTEADLYLWIADHREALREHYQLDAPPRPEVAVATFAETHSDLPVQKAVKKLRRTISMALGGGPGGLRREEVVELPTEEGAVSAIDSADREGEEELSTVQLPTEWGWMDVME
ncbi:MAG TPA: ParB N-terminal domain-containing protein [Caldilineae bacterium]|nr:ParB N-terminal domain-containing protein [Caldilineae bacterium]